MIRGVVIMGVAGCGKTTVGQAVAARTGIAYVDGDDLHPAMNIAKMSAGIALDDDDRAPWLRDVGRAIAAEATPILIGCSALKRVYRDWIRAEAGGAVAFVHLHAPQSVIAGRMAERAGHFMPPSLLESQFAALQPLQPDELGRVVDIDAPLERVAAQVEAHVKELLQ